MARNSHIVRSAPSTRLRETVRLNPGSGSRIAGVAVVAGLSLQCQIAFGLVIPPSSTTATPATSVAAPATSTSASSGFSILPTAPSGFSRTPAGMPPTSGLGGGLSSDLLDGLSVATSLSGTYDTNVTQSPGLPVAPVEDDFILSVGGTLNYLSKSAAWTFGGNYRGSYDTYFSNSDFNGYNQGAGLLANYEGGKVSASLSTGISYDQGSNRYYNAGDFVEQTSVNTALNVRYRLSPKTSLQGNLGQGFTTASGNSYSDTESINLGASALWRYSPLTEWGPGIRYTSNTGDSQTDRTSIGPTMTVNYKLSSKVALNSRVGVDFSSYEDGGSADPMVSASIGLNYQASKLWGMSFSLYRDAQADPSYAGGFTEVTALRLGYQRKIRRASWNLGLGYETNTSEVPDTLIGGTRPDRDYFSIDSSLGMPILSNTTMASIFMRYNDQSGSATDSFDSFQAGFSISRSF